MVGVENIVKHKDQNPYLQFENFEELVVVLFNNANDVLVFLIVHNY